MLQRPTQDRVVAEFNPDYQPKLTAGVSGQVDSEVEPEARQGGSKWAELGEEGKSGEFQQADSAEERRRREDQDDRPMQVLVKLKRRVLSLQLRALRRLLADHRGRLQRSLRLSKKRTRRVDNLTGRIERIESELAQLREEGGENEDEERLVVLKKIPRRYVFPGLMPRKQRDLLR